MTKLDRAFINAFGRGRPHRAKPGRIDSPAKPVSDEESPSQAINSRDDSSFHDRPLGEHSYRRIDLAESILDVVDDSMREDEVGLQTIIDVASPSFDEAVAQQLPGIPAPPNLAERKTDNSLLPKAAREDSGAEIKTSPKESNDKHTHVPLSMLSAKSPSARDFRPMLEVGRLQWPPICDRILAESDVAFAQQSANLVAMSRRGAKSFVITGRRDQEGRTTILLTLAKRFAASGLRLALVDSDFRTAVLAHRLGVAPQLGWEHVLRGDEQLQDVLVESVFDRTTILPLVETSANNVELIRGSRAAYNLALLKEQYEIVLVDAGPVAGRSLTSIVALAEHNTIDGAILVKDCRGGGPEPLAHARRLMDATGIPIVGEVENFAPPTNVAVKGA